jgi:hypothetical protein
MAFAELRLTEKEFWQLPPFRTYLMQMAYYREIDRRWEQTRFIAMMVHNTAQGKKQNMTPQQLIKLPFDNRQQQYPRWTQEEAEDLIGKWPDVKKKK